MRHIRKLPQPLLISGAIIVAIAAVGVIYAATLPDTQSSPRGSQAAPAPRDDRLTVAEPTQRDEQEANRGLPGGESASAQSAGDNPGAGRIDGRAETLPASTGCEQVEVHLHPGGGRSTQNAPPVPRLSAERKGDTIFVSYEFLARPESCEPVAILITANSVDKLDNVRSASTDGGSIPVEGARATVRVPLPRYGPAPYEARAGAYTRAGRRSPVTTVPVH